MPGCSDIELLMQDYLDGYLLPSQQEVLDGHVRDCPACRSLLSGMRRLDEGLVGLPEVEAPADLGERILASIPEGQRLVPFPLRPSLGRRGMMAAAAACMKVPFR